MALVSDRCICLRKLEYSETSQILLLLGRQQGLLRVIAKGAHRRTKAGASRFGGGLDLLDVGAAVFTDRTDKDLATLTEWRLLEGHVPLRRSLRGLYLGFYAAELVSLLIEERDPHPALYDQLEHTLEQLGTPAMEQVFLAFELELLRQTGYLPHLGSCAACGATLGRQDDAWFSAARGGVLCRRCEGAYPDRQALDRRLLDLLNYLMRLGGTARLPVLSRHQTDPLNRLLAEHMQQTLGKGLRVGRYVL